MLFRSNVLFLIVFLISVFAFKPDTDIRAKRLEHIELNFKIRQPMANFTPIFEKTEGWEGGYQSYSSDKANYTSSGKLVGTNRGISGIAYEQYLGYEPSVADMKAITRNRAKAVYVKLFWNKIRGSEIKNQDVADIIFATYIGNPAKSNKIVQASLAQLGRNVSVKTPYPDEVVSAINRTNSEKLFYTIKEEKRKFLESLRYTYPQFINGWMRKLNSFEYAGNKKKWLIISVSLIALLAGSYYVYKKQYHKSTLKYLTSWQ